VGGDANNSGSVLSCAHVVVDVCANQSHIRHVKASPRSTDLTFAVVRLLNPSTKHSPCHQRQRHNDHTQLYTGTCRMRICVWSNNT
jgi:hypothetical protein